MSRTEESRKRREEKTRDNNKKFLIVIGLLLVIILGSVFTLAKNFLPSTDDRVAVSKGENQGNPNDKKDDDKAVTKDTEESEETEDREAIEKERREKYGDFYVPLPEEKKESKDFKARGLYLNQTTTSMDFSRENINLYREYIKYLKGEREDEPADWEYTNDLERALALCHETEINSLVINVKNDDGNVIWDSDIKVVSDLGTDLNSSGDNFEGLLKYMKENDIYPIARIVAFKDHILPEIRPEHGMKLYDGSLYYDEAGTAWVDQYDKYVWDYVLSISKEAALRGFEEIHFDYIRFPDNAIVYNEIVDTDHAGGITKAENIKNFIKYAEEELEPYGVQVGAAVFGIITASWEDYPEDIGQTWLKITQGVDVIAPMIYPSHYSTGWYGYEYPDAHPYGVMSKALKEGVQKNAAVDNPGKIRPWIQDFTASWVDGYIEYTPVEVGDQIRAAVELGIEEYLVWNAGNDYNPLSFVNMGSFSVKPVLDPKNLPEFTMEDVENERNDGEPRVIDLIDKSPYRLLSDYLFTLGMETPQEVDTEFIYLALAKGQRPSSVDEFEGKFMEEDELLYNPTILNVTSEKDKYIFEVQADYFKGDLGYNGVEVFEVVLEGGVFKIIPPSLNFDDVQPMEIPLEEEGEDY